MTQNPEDPRAVARKKRQALALKANIKRRKEAAHEQVSKKPEASK